MVPLWMILKVQNSLEAVTVGLWGQHLRLYSWKTLFLRLKKPLGEGVCSSSGNDTYTTSPVHLSRLAIFPFSVRKQNVEHFYSLPVLRYLHFKSLERLDIWGEIMAEHLCFRCLTRFEPHCVLEVTKRRSMAERVRAMDEHSTILDEVDK